ncbi:Fructose import permease protein FrcC [subsurface metagenome]
MSETIRQPGRTRNAQGIARRIFRHENATLVIVLIALMGGIAFISHGVSLSRANLMNILLQVSIKGMASIGQAFVILTAGIDLSVGGMGLVSSIVGASMLTEAPHLNIVGHAVPIGVGALVMLLVGAGFGLANGALVSRVGMPGLIVTLGMWQICKGVGYGVGGGYTITYLPEGLLALGQGNIAGVPVPSIVFIVIAVVAYLILNYTSFGRSVYTVGGNPASAWLSGINVKKILLMAYMVSIHARDTAI